MEQDINQDICIGKNIKKARISAGLSQEQLSSKLQVVGCDISRGTLAKIEVGIRHLKVSEINEIIKILKIDYNYLFQKD
jgi:transcriptional regulator with XRE-family HTH domain